MTSCRQRRWSVDIRKAAFAQTSQAFAFAGRQISRCRAAMTPEQEKALHDALDPLAGELATLKIMLRRLRAEGRIFARWPHEPIDHGMANAIRSAYGSGDNANHIN
jgi:hypothetical protein